ncbi:MAG TPA: efflux RND transporter periplasmic adaptor subunit [Verrucomicrobiae bacterium]|nr:efflux RND transporter periplasmic adaptor subunit [Verrucomicrobiae bacterium]
MNRPSHFHKIFSFALAIFAMSALVLLSSCQKQATESKPPDVDYYTCTMHPSVRSQDPHGKCPICGMDLVPVKKKSSGTNAMTKTNMETMPAMEGGKNMESEEQPGEFTVPLERQQQIGVTYAAIETHPFQKTIRAVGTVDYDKQRQWDYVARINGYVEKLNVFSPGEVVEAGTVLLSIYSPDLFTAQKEFVDALKMRHDAQAAHSPDVLKSAGELVESGKERLRLWNITADQISELEKTRKPRETLDLISPFKGVVQQLGVDQGRRVAVGDRLVSVADYSVIWVWAQFYQDELPMLKKELPVTISISAYPDKKFEGKIALVDPFMNDALRTGRVRIDVQNPDFKLRPGMYVDVELSVDNGAGLAVPVNAVLPTGLHDIAFVDKGGGRLEPRYIELGRKYGDFYEVKSGLKAGERVVTSANFLIDAEAKVQGALKSF